MNAWAKSTSEKHINGSLFLTSLTHNNNDHYQNLMKAPRWMTRMHAFQKWMIENTSSSPFYILFVFFCCSPTRHLEAPCFLFSSLSFYSNSQYIHIFFHLLWPTFNNLIKPFFTLSYQRLRIILTSDDMFTIIQSYIRLQPERELILYNNFKIVLVKYISICSSTYLTLLLHFNLDVKIHI